MATKRYYKSAQNPRTEIRELPPPSISNAHYLTMDRAQERDSNDDNSIMDTDGASGMGNRQGKGKQPPSSSSHDDDDSNTKRGAQTTTSSGSCVALTH